MLKARLCGRFWRNVSTLRQLINAGTVGIMTRRRLFLNSMAGLAAGALAVAACVSVWTASGQENPAPSTGSNQPAAAEETTFGEHIQPLLQEFCLRCHNVDNMKSG